MPTFYLDASAIAKRYFQDEQGSRFMLEFLAHPSPEDRLVTSLLSIVEVKAAISRRIENPSRRTTLLASIDDTLHAQFELQPVDMDIIELAGVIAEALRLRAGDAIHLASALSVAANNDPSQIIMISSDAELLDASESAGIGALDPQAEGAADSLRQFRAQ